MILFVDTNPILERRLIGDSFPKGGTGRASSSETIAAGYGADMAILANNMNEESRLLTFLGGLAGERYERILRQSGNVVEVQRLKDETQERFVMEEKYKTSRIYTEEPRLTREDILDFYERFVIETASSDAVVLAKGTRSDNPEEMKLPMVRYARKKSKPVMMFSDENDAVDAVREAKPFGIIIDRDALGRIAGKKLQFLSDVTSALKALYGGDIPLILVTGGVKGSILYFRGECYYAKNDEESDSFNPHFAGVAMAAGIVRNYDAPMLLKLAAAAAQSERDADFAKIKSDMNRIHVQKMEV
ncbi:MAG: PfkB family carbohydrate kinase [Peptoniphilus sp.]|nr:PfkB family carbohydrate kinase [Peptoniphilus sp.]MDD7363093.1 PfkB family carbohydrate kinase [Bacillota bacterium]MDY6044385.1 PfkB family carbohydrate kinase [Peptoniphilus sp.]